MGTACSFLQLIVLLMYTYQKIDILIQRKDVDYLSATYDTFFDDKDTFGID